MFELRTGRDIIDERFLWSRLAFTNFIQIVF